MTHPTRRRRTALIAAIAASTLALTGAFAATAQAAESDPFTISRVQPVIDGNLVYTAVDTTLGAIVGTTGGNEATLRIIDPATGATTRSASLAPAATLYGYTLSAVVIDRAAHRAYASGNTGSSAISVVDLATGGLTTWPLTVPAEASVTSLALDEANHRLYVQIAGSAFGVAVIDTPSGSVVATQLGDYRLAGVDSSANRAIVRGATQGIAAISGADGTVTTLLAGATGFRANTPNFGIDVSRHVLVGVVSNVIRIVDWNTGDVRTIAVSSVTTATASRTVVDEANDVAYVSTSAGGVLVVDLASAQIVASVDTGSSSAPGVAIDPATRDLYATGTFTVGGSAVNGFAVIEGANAYRGGTQPEPGTPTEPTAPTGPFTIQGTAVTGGTLTWGVKESWRRYIVGPIAQGSIETSAEVTRTEAGEFVFPQGSGVISASGDDAAVSFAGEVHFTGHHGLLDVRLTDPTIVIKGRWAYLTAKAVGPDKASHDNWPIVRAKLAVGKPVKSGSTYTYTALPTEATAEQVTLFQDYPEGTAFDPITFTVTAGSTAASWNSADHPSVRHEPASANDVRVTVPEWVNQPETGSFGWAFASATPASLGVAQQQGSTFVATGALTDIIVTDTRAGGSSPYKWSVSGQSGDFASGATTFGGSFLGWTPRVVQGGSTVTASPEVTSTQLGGVGLGASSVLASSTAAASARIGADLKLVIPGTTPAGDYTATLTVTALQ